MKFDVVRLPANDVHALAEFYGSRLNLPIIHHDAGEVHFQVAHRSLFL